VLASYRTSLLPVCVPSRRTSAGQALQLHGRNFNLVSVYLLTNWVTTFCTVQGIRTLPWQTYKKGVSLGLVPPGPRSVSSSYPFLLDGGLVNMSELAEKAEQHNYETSSTYSSSNEVVFHADQTKGPQHPNRWAEIRFVWCHLFVSGVSDGVVHRASIREPLAEFLGSMILLILGCGGNCQVVLSTNTAVASSPKGVSIQFRLKSTVQLNAMIRPSSPLTLAGLSVRGK